MKATTYLYVFYGYINISGKEVKTFVIPGKVVRAVEELRCRDGTGRTYIQGCMVLKEPMTPTQLRRAVGSPCLMLVASDNSTASREERMHLYTEVMHERGGVMYEPETLHIMGDANAFTIPTTHSDDEATPVYNHRFVVHYVV